jgi:Fe-S cluster assembly iron-binding protein IscA
LNFLGYRGVIFAWLGAELMTITLTENAATQIRRQLVKHGKGIARRDGLKKAGCTGLEYTFEIADSFNMKKPKLDIKNTEITS